MLSKSPSKFIPSALVDGLIDGQYDNHKADRLLLLTENHTVASAFGHGMIHSNPLLTELSDVEDLINFLSSKGCSSDDLPESVSLTAHFFKRQSS